MTLDPQRVQAFYQFVVERETIRQRRLLGLPRDWWTGDPILQTYSFTNVKREHDRTTQEFAKLYKPILWNRVRTPELLRSLFINCALYRYFGTVQSAKRIGVVYEWDAEQRKSLILLGDTGQLSFTSAYIVTSGGRSEPKHYVVADTIDALWKIADIVVDCTFWEDAIRHMCRCYGVGSFMAKEVYLDYLLATGDKPRDWDTWTPVGPGARRGAGRVKLGWLEKIPEDDALEVIRELYALRDEHWPRTVAIAVSSGPPSTDDVWKGESQDVEFPTLDLTDVQFQLCEFDKYMRAVEGGRPKRLFRPTSDEITTRKT